jgi:hypothetical protein
MQAAAADDPRDAAVSPAATDHDAFANGDGQLVATENPRATSCSRIYDHLEGRWPVERQGVRLTTRENDLYVSRRVERDYIERRLGDNIAMSSSDHRRRRRVQCPSGVRRTLRGVCTAERRRSNRRRANGTDEVMIFMTMEADDYVELTANVVVVGLHSSHTWRYNFMHRSLSTMVDIYTSISVVAANRLFINLLRANYRSHCIGLKLLV